MRSAKEVSFCQIYGFCNNLRREGVRTPKLWFEGPVKNQSGDAVVQNVKIKEESLRNFIHMFSKVLTECKNPFVYHCS